MMRLKFWRCCGCGGGGEQVQFSSLELIYGVDFPPASKLMAKSNLGQSGRMFSVSLSRIGIVDSVCKAKNNCLMFNFNIVRHSYQGI